MRCPPPEWPRHYRGLVDALVIDTADAGLAAAIESGGARAIVADDGHA